MKEPKVENFKTDKEYYDEMRIYKEFRELEELEAELDSI